MSVTLEVLNTEANIRRVQITRTAVLGRAKDCGLRIASKRVSRRHCEILLAEDAIRIRDLGSSNGTFVNNEPLVPGVVFELEPNDEVRLGSVRLRVEFEAIEIERPVLAPTAASGAADDLIGPPGSDEPANTELSMNVDAGENDAALDGSLKTDSPIDGGATIGGETIGGETIGGETIAADSAVILGRSDQEEPRSLASVDDEEDDPSFLDDSDLAESTPTASSPEPDDSEPSASDSDLLFPTGQGEETNAEADDDAILDFLNNLD